MRLIEDSIQRIIAEFPQAMTALEILEIQVDDDGGADEIEELRFRLRHALDTLITVQRRAKGLT